jgi:hypothetical protein
MQLSDRNARRDELIAANVCIGMAVLMVGAMMFLTFLS